MSKEAMTLALELFEQFGRDSRLKYEHQAIYKTIVALKEALAKQEQGEPVTQTDGQTRPWFTINELNEWADKYQNQEWRNAAIRLGEELASVGPNNYYNMEAKDWLDWAMANVQPSQPKQEQGEPVLWAAKESMFMWGNSDESGHPYHIICKGKKVKSHQIPLYTTPQPAQKRWTWLTLDERSECYEQSGGNLSKFAKAIEAKLKEKNNA